MVFNHREEKMSLESLVRPFPWTEYSKKLVGKIEHPYCAGIFEKSDAESRQMRLIVSQEGEIADGNALRFYWLVDPEDGMIVDARFQAFGQSALIGAAEAACELIVHKYYDQAGRIGADLIDKHLRDKVEVPAFPFETAAHLNLVVDAIEKAAAQCTDIPLPEAYISPVPAVVEGLEGGYPGWAELSLTKKLAVIEQVINQDVRPYIELDGGGVEVINLIENREVIISYQGNCTSCFSSTGATLSYIQQILRSKVCADIIVVPDFGG
jgi:NifU-like protein